MYKLQAKDSVSGAMFYWLSATHDGADYPGPNAATELAVMAQHPTGSGGGGGNGSNYGFQGQREIAGGAEAIPAGGFIVAHEIPVTIREGKAYAASWLLGLQGGSSVSARTASVRFYLTNAPETWDVYVAVTAYWERSYPAGTVLDTPCGSFPLLTTGSGPAVPVVPGEYWLRMIVEEQTSTGELNLNDFHPPMLQLLEFDAAPEEP